MNPIHSVHVILLNSKKPRKENRGYRSNEHKTREKGEREEFNGIKKEKGQTRDSKNRERRRDKGETDNRQKERKGGKIHGEIFKRETRLMDLEIKKKRETSVP